MKVFLILGIGLLLAGCTHREPAGPATMTLNQARQFVLANKTAIFIDPDSVRDAAISAPYATPRAQNTICVQANARNRLGGYTGLTRVGIFIQPNGAYETATFNGPNDGCEVQLYPFPELGR